MKSLLLGLLLLISASAAAGQQATPKPTPVELKLERLTTITAITRTLKGISASDPKFESKEDLFRIQLPRDPALNKPAEWPKAPGEMPKPGRTSWNLVEADIGVSVTPLPPGLVPSWSKDELAAQQTNTINNAVGGTGGKKSSEREVSSGAFTGKEIKIEARGTILFSRVFFANDRQYVVLAALKKGGDSEALVKAVFDTFEIVQQKELK